MAAAWPGLPPETWAARHRGLLVVLLAHLVFLPAFAVTQGWSLQAAWLFDLAPATFGALAWWRRPSRAVRSSLCALALLACSAALVVAWHGTVEAHFHYFVMVGALALYEEWWAYLIAIGFVVFQHGVMGAFNDAVFPHAHSPWRWAAIHGAFVAALAVANLISWRANESIRGATGRSRERFRRAFDDAPVAMALVAPDGRLLQTNRELRERTGHGNPTTCASGTSSRPTTARRCAPAGRRSPTARRPSAATCAPTARSAGSCGDTR